MKRKCECGQTHDFVKFRSFETTFGGRTTHFQAFCQDLSKLMILTTTTFPSSISGPQCPETYLKKFKKTEVLQDSDRFFNSGLYLLSKK